MSNEPIDLTTEEDVYLYPNPAESVINIQSEMDQLNIDVYDMNGKLVKKIAIDENASKEVSVEDLTPGVYLLDYKSEEANTTTTRKLIVK